VYGGAALGTTYSSTTLTLSASVCGGDLRPGADLVLAQLAGADLQGCDLSRADLQAATLTGAHLQGANLRNAILSGAVLNGADLRGVDLRGAVVPSAQLTGVTWGATICPDGVSSDAAAGTCTGHLLGHTFVVNVATDAPDDNPGDGVCRSV